MNQRSNPARTPLAWACFGPLTVVAILPFLSWRQGPATQAAAGGALHSQAPQAIQPRLAEAPPEHPPAAPCGECSSGCGAGPRGIPSVYLHSGEFHLREVDLVIPGRGLDFVWARTYRSRIGPSTAQGNGWDFSYGLRVEGGASGVRVMDGGGRSDLYELQPDGSYAAPELFREGRFGPDGTFTLLFADQGTWTFFPLDGSPLAGKVRTIADRNGNTLGFDYDGFGRLTLVVDTLGREIDVSYDASGRIAALTDFLGRQVVYDYYDPLEPGGSPGDLKSARSPLVTGTPNGNDFPAGKTTAYTYTAGFADERLNHNLLTVTDPKGQTWLVNEYASQTDPSRLLFDRLVRQRRGDPGDLIDVTYATVQRDGSPALLAIVNDPAGNVSELEYDLLGRCIARRSFTGRADPDLPTTRTSNRPTNPLRAADPAFFETRWSYDADSLVKEIVFPNGNLMRNLHEKDLDPLAPPRSRGNLRERRRLPGTHLPVGDQSELVELLEYDTGFGGCCGSNFVTRHTDARGNVTEHDYDAAGNRIQTRHRIPSIVEDFTYDAFGRRTSHVHPDNGKGWRQVDVWTYYGPAHGHQNGYLRSHVADANGFALTTSWTYDAAGNAVQVTNSKGDTTTMVVNALNQVVRQVSPPVEMMNGTMVQYEVDTWYDANDNVVRVDTQAFDDEGNPAADPYLTTWSEYETLNRLVRVREEVDSTRDVVTEYEYDALRNRTLVRFGEATRGAQPTNVVRTLYDERNLLFRRILAEGDPQQSTAQHDYDGNGARVRLESGLEDPPARVQTSILDAYGRPVSEVDAMGNVTSRGYDANGNLVHLRVDGELCDVPGSAGNVRLYEATYAYDAMDRLVSTDVQHFDPATQMPIGDGISRILRSWTARSELLSQTDDNGNATSYCYDTAGRPDLVTDAKGNSVRTLYDANGNVVQVIETEKADSGGPDQVFAATRSYDELDRQTIAEDALGNEVFTGYDSRGNATRVVDALGNVTIHAYDGLDRLVSSTRLLTDDGTGGGAVVGKIGRGWSWDDSSRLVAQTDDKGNVTAYVYDALGRRERTVLADGNAEVLAHDAHGNVIERSDPNGTRVTSTYDLGNRLAARAIVPGAGVSADTTFEVWKHDGLARLVHAQDDDSLVTRAWDSLSNAIRETQNGKSVLCAHDGMGNELGLVYPGGRVVTCTYDALDRVKTIANMGPVASYDYVGPWRLERRTTAGGPMTSLYGYDGARRVTTIEHFAGAAAPLDRRSFEWDPMYDRTEETDLASGEAREYGYDSQYRITRSRRSVPGMVVSDVRYAYDGAGNRTSTTGGACAGAYAAGGVMNQYTSAPCVGAIAYDANGNQTARGGVETLAYDYRDRLVLHRGPGGTTAFSHDALGRVVAKVGKSTVRYYYHGFDVIEERDASDAVLGTYVWSAATPGALADLNAERGIEPTPFRPGGGAGHELVEMQRGGRTYFFLGDDLGSPRVVTDAAGAAVERYAYDEAGLPSFADGAGAPLPASAIGNAWLFNGKRWDAETGFYDYRTRSMDPRLGQYLSRDLLGPWGDPVNLGNARTYVANNFQTLVDPTGMFAYSVACGGPWPGPRTVPYDTSGCGGKNATIEAALCGAMRGAGRAKRLVDQWVSFELNGYPGGLSWWTAVPFLEWFGGPDGDVSVPQMLAVSSVLSRVWFPFLIRDPLQIHCDGSCTKVALSNVSWPWAPPGTDMVLCPAWWNGTTGVYRAATILHELTHSRAGTDDHFYTYNRTKASTFSLYGIEVPNVFESHVLVDNASTYHGLYQKWFVK